MSERAGVDAGIAWADGVAAVIGATKHHVTVECCFCGGVHQHERPLLGGEVVAGCHVGHGCHCVYVIPQVGVR